MGTKMKLFEDGWEYPSSVASNLLAFELEYELWRMVLDPARYDEVWDRLEKIKRDEVVRCKEKKIPIRSEFDFVDGTRKPFYADGEIGEDLARQNRRDAMIILMFAEKCCPRFYIEEYVAKILGYKEKPERKFRLFRKKDPSSYKITNKFTDVFTENQATLVEPGAEYRTVLSVPERHEIIYVSVEMGKKDVTWRTYGRNKIIIPKVTGDVEIVAISKFDKRRIE